MSTATTTVPGVRPATFRNLRPAPLLMAMLAGPVLFLVGQALMPTLPDSLDRAFPVMVEHREQLMAARLFTAAGAFLLVPAAVGYARLIPAGCRGARLLLVGAWAFGIATFSNALSQSVSGYATWVVSTPHVDASAGQYVVGNVESGLVAMPIGFWSIPGFVIGTLLIATALWRSRRGPSWVPVLIVLGAVLAAAFAGRGPIVALTQLPFTIALLALPLVVPNDPHR